jgi:hypothetical protein
MKRLLTVALLCAATGALAADTKPAPKTAAPKTEAKSDMKPMADEGKNLKVEEADQKEPKNKHTDVKAQGPDKKDAL